MDDRKADLFAHFRLAGADRLNILLIEHDVIGSRRQVEYALLGRGHAMEETQKQPPLLPRTQCGRWLVRRHILNQNSNVTNATAKFLGERVERLLDYLDEMFALHPSPTKINKGTLTPTSVESFPQSYPSFRPRARNTKRMRSGQGKRPRFVRTTPRVK